MLELVERDLLQFPEDRPRGKPGDAGRRGHDVSVLARFPEHLQVDAGKPVEALEVTLADEREDPLQATLVLRKEDEVVPTVDWIVVLVRLRFFLVLDGELVRYVKGLVVLVRGTLDGRDELLLEPLRFLLRELGIGGDLVGVFFIFPPLVEVGVEVGLHAGNVLELPLV